MRKRAFVFNLALAGIGGGLVGCTKASSPLTREAPEGMVIAPGQIGSRLPEFAVKDLHGNEISAVNLRGKVVLIDFWATWCQPCKKEMTGYQKLLDQYGALGFAVIGLKFDTMADTENPFSFAKRLGIHYPLAVAPEDLKLRFGGIEGLPTTMLYDRQGILRQKVIGFEYTDVIESELKPLL